MNDQKASDELRPLAAMLNEIGESLIAELAPAAQLGRDALREAEGEMRRGLVAINGAGLVAVISLLSATLDSIVVHIAAALYFFGLLSGGGSWWFRVSSTSAIALSPSTLRKVLNKLKSDPKLNVLPKSHVEIDEILKTVKSALEEFRDTTTSGSEVSKWFTYFAVAFFFLSTIMLIIDYEYQFVGSLGNPASIQLSTTSPKPPVPRPPRH